jgi:hypothetical protein
MACGVRITTTKPICSIGSYVLAATSSIRVHIFQVSRARTVLAERAVGGTIHLLGRLMSFVFADER